MINEIFGEEIIRFRIYVELEEGDKGEMICINKGVRCEENNELTDQKYSRDNKRRIIYRYCISIICGLRD